jgi:uncharacterized protein (TIGR02597 family)
MIIFSACNRVVPCALIFLAGAAAASAQTVVASSPGGVVPLTIPAGSDFYFAAPLIQSPEFIGSVLAVSGSTITVNQTNGQPDWTKNSLVYSGSQSNTYYALVASGTKEGMASLITANGTNSLTVDLAGDSFTGITTGSNGDSIKIVPYWTLTTLFTNCASPSFPTGSYVMTYNGVPGINSQPSNVYYFDPNGSLGRWYSESTGELSNNVCIPPSQSVVIRNYSASPFTLNIPGNVPLNKQYALLSTLAPNTQQDNPIGYLSPLPATLGQTGLGLTNQDQLLVFDNAATGINKSATEVITYYAGYGWYDGSTAMDATFQLQPGFGYILRRAATATPTSILWQNEQPYLPISAP